MREIEKYVMAIALVALIGNIYLYWTLFDFSFWELESKVADSSDIEKRRTEQLQNARFRSNLRVILNFASQFVSCAWLYFAAKTESLSKSAWAIFGLSFGVIGVACYYAASVHYQLIGLRRKSSAKKT